jgi:hypothetical protein
MTTCFRYMAENGNWTCITNYIVPAAGILRPLTQRPRFFNPASLGFYGNSRFRTADILDITWFLWQQPIPKCRHLSRYLASIATSDSTLQTFQTSSRYVSKPPTVVHPITIPVLPVHYQKCNAWQVQHTNSEYTA